MPLLFCLLEKGADLCGLRNSSGSSALVLMTVLGLVVAMIIIEIVVKVLSVVTAGVVVEVVVASSSSSK